MALANSFQAARLATQAPRCVGIVDSAPHVDIWRGEYHAGRPEDRLARDEIAEIATPQANDVGQGSKARGFSPYHACRLLLGTIAVERLALVSMR